MLRCRANLGAAVEQHKSGNTVPCKKTQASLITVEEMVTAEREILRHVQKENFQEEI